MGKTYVLFHLYGTCITKIFILCLILQIIYSASYISDGTSSGEILAGDMEQSVVEHLVCTKPLPSR